MRGTTKCVEVLLVFFFLLLFCDAGKTEEDLSLVKVLPTRGYSFDVETVTDVESATQGKNAGRILEVNGKQALQVPDMSSLIIKPGKFGDALVFRTEREGILFSPDICTEEGAIMMWFGGSDLRNENLMRFYNDRNNYLRLDILKYGEIRATLERLGNREMRITSKSQVKRDEWNHVAYVWKKNLAGIFVNGEFQGQARGRTSLTFLRSAQLDFAEFKGAVDEVSFWNTALTVSEVSRLSRVPVKQHRVSRMRSGEDGDTTARE